jgi:hypothetical protein
VRRLFDDAEVIPCNNRSLDFRLTVRDGKSGQGTSDVRVNVVDTGGAGFVITGVNGGVTAIAGGAPFDVLWNPAGTRQAPVSCPTVDIELLTFAPNYATYSVHPLAIGTDNDGSESVETTPATNAHPLARIRVTCANNIFYDISDTDLSVTSTGGPAGTFDQDDLQTFFNDTNGTTGLIAPACGVPVECPLEVSGNGKRGGSSAFGYLSLLLLAGLAGVAAVRRRGTVQGLQ